MSGGYQNDGTNGTKGVDRPVERAENVPSPFFGDGTLMERWNVADHHDLASHHILRSLEPAMQL